MAPDRAPPPFAELCARSCFSFLDGASHPEELVRQSRALGHRAIALCDRDGLYGSVRMHAAGRELAHRTLVGAELTVELAGRARPYTALHHPAILLIAMSARGYASLCRLLTAAHADHDKGEAGIPAAAVAEGGADLFALLPLDPRAALPAAQIALVREAFGARAAVVTWRHLEPLDRARVALAEESSRRFGLPVVASARPRYHDRERKPLADVMRCIRLGTTLDRAGAALEPNAEAVLRPAASLARLFPDREAWIARTAEIADACTFSLSELRYRFPCEFPDDAHAPAQEKDKTAPGPDARLRDAVEAGCRTRYPDGVPAEVRAQLERELALIAELEVAPYFLSVQQIVEIARARGILCQGRGSAANSAVCFVLGITAVDPARSAMLFERFLSAERREPPDIDVDFEHERREEVIQELYRRFGRDRAAMVSEVISYRGRSALREVGKVFGLSADVLDRLSSVVGMRHEMDDGRSRQGDGTARGPRHGGAVSAATVAALERRGLDLRDERLQRVLSLAGELEGMPRHLSIHVGGFVLSAEPLWHVAPIEPARMEGRTVVPWDKDDLDALGFFKIDVLGLGMLTAIRKALASVHAYENEPGDFDPIAALAHIPPEDPAVYDACSRADTVGVFQIESRAQMAMLPLLRPRCFYDLVVEVGIVRPGPIQGKMVHPYLRRRTGEEPVEHPHPCLAPILERTLGVPLFQEQVMQIAIVGAGYTPGEADQLRRDMAAWRRNGRLARHRDRLLAGFAERGIPRSFGERLFRQIQGFGEYGFPESHAASFALLVYASSWLKVHHPAAFACALVNSQPMGFYAPGTLVRDAQHHGVEVRPVCVTRSDWDCTLEPVEGGAQALRLGLRMVRGLGQAAAERIVTERRRRAFGDLDDLVTRTRLARDDLERLADAGALERLEKSRREAHWRLRAPRERDGLLADCTIEPGEPAGLPPLTARELLALDYGSVGVSLHDHPMRQMRAGLDERGVRLASEQQRWRRGAEVTVAGVVLTRQRPGTASGIVFITLEDETGVVNLVVYAGVFDHYELAARHASILLARGRVDRRGTVVHVRVQHLERLDVPAHGAAASPLLLRSRDFH
jgi:error-prone DNA polymerase